jgi:hypothetical protein
MSFRLTQYVGGVTHQKCSTVFAELYTNIHTRLSCRKKRNSLKSQYTLILYALYVYILAVSLSGFILLVFTTSPSAPFQCPLIHPTPYSITSIFHLRTSLTPPRRRLPIQKQRRILSPWPQLFRWFWTLWLWLHLCFLRLAEFQSLNFGMYARRMEAWTVISGSGDKGWFHLESCHTSRIVTDELC